MAGLACCGRRRGAGGARAAVARSLIDVSSGKRRRKAYALRIAGMICLRLSCSSAASRRIFQPRWRHKSDSSGIAPKARKKFARSGIAVVGCSSASATSR